MTEPILVRPYRSADLDRVVEVWCASKLDVYTFIPLEQTYTREENLAFFEGHVLPRCDLFVAEQGGQIVGFLAMAGSYVDRLYVLPGRQRGGVGTRLIDRARERSPGGLELHTHQKNERARRFYEKHGFEAVKFGVSPPPESEPDVEYHWPGR
jgi:ribosomal protein S18 acetylase RimI-like enzyme